MIEDPRFGEGIRLFQEGHYFEAHEELELVWRATPAGPVKQLLQALIQLAVSLEHWRRGNPRGARGQWEKARAKAEPLPSVLAGVAIARLLADFRAFYAPWDLDACVEAQMAGRWTTPEVTGPWPAPHRVDQLPPR